ncbi:MAG: restriction endonuclease subunit S [Planctomycetes bacterium]|nr:restriction endonuclease subunit S [Planctomycetota bacterium]
MTSDSAWHGHLPEGWTTRRFKHAARIRGGQVDPKLGPYRDLPLYAPNHIESNTGRLLGIATAAEQGAESGKYVVEAGDIIYSKIRPALRKVAIAPQRGLCSADVYAIHPATGVTAWFLYWAMLTEGFYRYTLLESDRVAMPKINRESLGECPIPITDESRQDQVASFLNHKTAAIDALIAKKERLIELLQEKRQALITQAVTKGLDPNVPMKDSGIEWIGEIPAHWTLIRLKYATPAITVGIVVRPTDHYAESGVPALRSLNIGPGTIRGEDLVHIREESHLGLLKSAIYEGDLVAVRTGQPGTTAVVPPELDNCNCIDLIVIRKSDEFDSHYLCYLMNSPVTERQFVEGSDGAIQRHFNIETAKGLLVVMPPREDQHRLVDRIRVDTAAVDRTIRTSRDLIRLLAEYRQALITAAVTGQIDIAEMEAAAS